MRILGQIIAFILALLAVVFFTLSAWNVAVAEALYAEDTYNAVLDDERVFEELLPVALPALLEAAENDPAFENEFPVEIADINSALSREEWRELTGLLVPPEWLQARADQLVRALLRVVEGDLTVLDDELDFSVVRERLGGEEANRAVELVLSGAPMCTQTQIDRLRTLQAGRGNGDVKFPVCNPADDDLREFSESLMLLFFNGLANVIPANTVTVGEFYSIDTDGARLISLFGQVDVQSGLLLYLCPMALLSLIVVAAVRSRQSFSRWIGATSLISGGLLLVTLLLGQVFLLSSISDALQATDDVQQFAARVFSAIARSLFAGVSSALLVQIAFFVLLGFFLLATSFFGRGDDDDSIVLVTEDGEIISTASQRRSSVQPGKA